ncbi:MAG TPA: alpha/beta hydrolase [Acidimicrobiia bacterium]|nr:alpha/beta hydrolase [Acidimicrobiia bacterium]
MPTVRLSSHRIQLADGHSVQALVAGRGVPLVVVHGFAAEGLLYAQSLSRLCSLGFKVVAIDTAGHGGTAVLPHDGLELAAYSRLLGRAVSELGIRRAIYAGHSMGGRLITELAAADPDRVVALLLIDAIVGDAWDQIVQACRWWPPLLGLFSTAAVVDSLATLSLDDTAQSVKLARLWARTALGDITRPWQLMMPFLSVLRSPGSRVMLDDIGAAGIPVVVLHGDRDYVVPLAAARDAARRTAGELVVVRGGTHSWLLKDPESFPAIMSELLRNGLGGTYEQALVDAGLDPGAATTADIEGAFYAPGARVLSMTPEPVYARSDRRSVPRYDWVVEDYSRT